MVFTVLWGLILCDSKYLQFHSNKKHKNIGSHIRKYYIPLCHTFLKLMELLVPLVSHKYLSCCGGSIIIFDGCWLKIFFSQISLCIRVFNSKYNLARPFFIYKVMYVLGCYNELTVV